MRHNGIWMAVTMSLGMAAMTVCGVGCGDDATMPDAGPGVDAAPGRDAGQGADAGPGATAFLVGSSYAGVGVASILELPSLGLTTNAIDGVASDDPVLRYFDGLVYVVNRFGHDNVTIVDPSTRTLVAQISTGPGSNPQDAAPRGSTLYVAALGAPGILVLDAERPEDGVVGTIDLSALDPADGLPDCSSVYLVGDVLYATCSVLDGFDAVRPGVVAMIDATDNSLIASFDLETRNPIGFLQPTPADSELGGDLLVATVDFGDSNSGCIERIDVHAEDPGSSCLVSNATLGGYGGGLVHDGARDTLYVARSQGFEDGMPVAALVTYDVALGALAQEPITPAEQRPIDVTQCPTGELVVADALAGIRVYTTEGTELTSAPLDIGLPPVSRGAVCF